MVSRPLSSEYAIAASGCDLQVPAEACTVIGDMT
jgi:hypothetical protein